MSDKAIVGRIAAMLETCGTNERLLPHTHLYNEGWMLRLILDWFSNHRSISHKLQFPEDGKWFSEIQLLSAFPQKPGGAVLGEGNTNADGAIGHFSAGNKGKRDLALCDGATHLVTIEAKMFSTLSSGVTHAKYFDQAARTVACIVQALSDAGRRPADMTHLGFYLLAPKDQIEDGCFKEMNPESIHEKVLKRVEEYGEDMREWLSEWFEPTVTKLEIKRLAWEKVVSFVEDNDPSFRGALREFYQECLKHNRPSSRQNANHRRGEV